MDQLLGKGRQAEKLSKVSKQLQRAHEAMLAKFQRDYSAASQTMAELPRRIDPYIESMAKGIEFTVSMIQESNPGKKAFMEMLDSGVAEQVKRIRDIKL